MKVIFFFCLISLTLGCFAPKSSAKNEMRIPAKFDYSPPSRSSASATSMTIALISPVYVTKNPEYYVAPFPEMSKSMENDFEELLTAKGFNIRGPFRSRDEMVYNDKQSCDFAFIVEIDLQPTYNRKYDYDGGVGVIIPPSYKMSGEITLGGNLVITASSPQYGEKIWKKSIALENATFSYNSSFKWNGIPSVADELKQDNSFYNLFARELEKFYNGAMSLAWRQIEQSEMIEVAAQSKKADNRMTN